MKSNIKQLQQQAINTCLNIAKTLNEGTISQETLERKLKALQDHSIGFLRKRK